MMKIKFGQIIVLLLVEGLLMSCSKTIDKKYDNSTIEQIYSLNNVDLETIDGAKYFVTKDYEEAKQWRFDEMEEDRIVIGHLNKETGEYIYTSVPKDNISLPSEDKLLELLGDEGEFELDDDR